MGNDHEDGDEPAPPPQVDPDAGLALDATSDEFIPPEHGPEHFDVEVD
jgi:hypothetical protein